MILPVCALPTGQVPFILGDNQPVDSISGFQGYAGSFPRGTTTAVATADGVDGGINYSATGLVRLVDATAGNPAGTVTIGGCAVNAGRICYTTDAPGVTSTLINGIAYLPDGRMHITDISPFAWWRYNTSVTVTGSGVSQWSDVTGNARHLLQGTDTNRPAKQSDGSILFDGVDNYMQTGAFVLAQPYTIYLKINQVGWVAGNFITDGLAVASSIKPGGSSPEVRLNAGLTFAGVSQLTLGGYGALAGVFNGASSVIQVGLNAAVTGDASTTGLDGLTLGSSRVPSLYSNIGVKEIMLFNTAHDAATRTRVMYYMLGV